VHVTTSDACDHIAYVLTGFPTALSYIADRVAGTPAPNDCRSPAVTDRAAAKGGLSHLRVAGSLVVPPAFPEGGGLSRKMRSALP